MSGLPTGQSGTGMVARIALIGELVRFPHLMLEQRNYGAVQAVTSMQVVLVAFSLILMGTTGRNSKAEPPLILRISMAR
jgi:hypothetical protein